MIVLEALKEGGKVLFGFLLSFLSCQFFFFLVEGKYYPKEDSCKISLCPFLFLLLGGNIDFVSNMCDFPWTTAAF